MSEELLPELAAEGAALLELGVVLGQSLAFGVVAGRCSGAQAEAVRRLREENLYERCCEKWDDFCPKIRLTRVSPELIAPSRPPLKMADCTSTAGESR